MQSRPASRNNRYTWADYQAWPEGERWEIIGGVAFDMSPAPSTQHQSVAGRIFSRLERQLSGKLCIPFIAPTDVRLSDSDVVQPDILVVCDQAKIQPSHIEGAPDLAVEVLSPSTSLKDLREKKRLYQQAGVREYLVVDPLELYVQRFVLSDEGRYGEPDILGPREVLSVTVLEGIDIALWEVFGVEPPEAMEPVKAPVLSGH